MFRKDKSKKSEDSYYVVDKHDEVVYRGCLTDCQCFIEEYSTEDNILEVFKY